MVSDQQQFINAVTKAKASMGDLDYAIGRLTDDWKAALHACSRLAMFDMLPALAAISDGDRKFLITNTAPNPDGTPLPPGPIQPSPDRLNVLGESAFSRIMFAVTIIAQREIADFGIPEDQVNDGREFLNCTRLDNDGVTKKINEALTTARVQVGSGTCCDIIERAWSPILVEQRRRVINGKPTSLIANLAAAAHYMLARYHVCAAQTPLWRMKVTIDGYDAKKRLSILSGDSKLKGMGITSNPPFPPDFGIRRWAYKGADDGEADRLRCNPDTPVPLVGTVDGQDLQAEF